MIRFLVIGATITSCLALSSQASAQEWCNSPFWEPWPTSTMPIRWKLNVKFWDYPGAPYPGSFCDQNGCDDSSLRRAFEDVFAEIHNASGGKVRFLYDGTTAADPMTEMPGWLHIFPDQVCDVFNTDGLIGWAHAWDSGSGSTDSGWIGICSHRPTTPYGIPFVPWIVAGTGTPYSFHSVVLHEAMHILGMWHPGDCGATGATILEQPYGAAPSQHLTGTDIKFLNVEYPLREANEGRRYSYDGLTWSETGLALPWDGRPQSRFGATNNSTAYGIFLAWIDRIPYDRYLRVTLYGPGNSWTYKLSLASSTFARYHPGIAAANDSQVRVAHGTNYEDATGLYHLKSRDSADGGTTWGNPASITGTRTVMPGVSGTWDPATQQYIWLWRINGSGLTTNGRIAYKIGSNAPVTNWSLQASDTPSIACGIASTGGGKNCLLAFSSATDWGHLVKWTQCSVSAGQLNCFAIKTHPYYAVGSPTVAFSYDGFPYPWHIAINQGGWTTYMWRKGANQTDNFQDQTSFAYGSKSILPAAAARLIDQYPLAPSSRRYVFVPYF